MEEQLILEFKQNSIFRLNESARMVKIALENITERQLWERPNTNSNSIGNLLLHLRGNITQYAISSLGNLPDERKRDEEFEATQGGTKKELLTMLEDTVDKAKGTIQNATAQQLVHKREVQGFEFSGIGVIIHVVEHFSYHTGQIAFWVKQLNQEDLGFYDGHNLNIINPS